MKKKDLKDLIDIYHKELKGFGRSWIPGWDPSTEGIKALETILNSNGVSNLKDKDELSGWPAEIRVEDLNKDIRELTIKGSAIQQLQDVIDKFSLQTIGSATGIILDKIETKLLEDQLRVVRGHVVTLQADFKKDHILLVKDDKKVGELDDVTKDLKKALANRDFMTLMYDATKLVVNAQVSNGAQLAQRLNPDK